MELTLNDEMVTKKIMMPVVEGFKLWGDKIKADEDVKMNLQRIFDFNSMADVRGGNYYVEPNRLVGMNISDMMSGISGKVLPAISIISGSDMSVDYIKTIMGRHFGDDDRPMTIAMSDNHVLDNIRTYLEMDEIVAVFVEVDNLLHFRRDHCVASVKGSCGSFRYDLSGLRDCNTPVIFVCDGEIAKAWIYNADLIISDDNIIKYHGEIHTSETESVGFMDLAIPSPVDIYMRMKKDRSDI